MKRTTDVLNVVISVGIMFLVGSCVTLIIITSTVQQDGKTVIDKKNNSFLKTQKRSGEAAPLKGGCVGQDSTTRLLNR